MNFPRVKFTNTNNIRQQLAHLLTEAEEVKDAWIDGDYPKMAEELWDLVHSCETALRILEEKHNVEVNDIKCAVIKKNRLRGYYF